MATLHMNSLVTKPNPTAVRKALKSLPEGLTETYRSVLDRIDAQNSDDQEIANMVLLWLCYTKRPLTVKEIQEALSVDSDASDLDPYSMTEASVPLRPFTEHDGDFILLRSPPIVGRNFRPVQKITFTFTSRDQGFSDSGGKGTYDGSFTWFNAARQREGSSIRPFTIVKSIHAGGAFKTHTITWTSAGRLDNYSYGADTAFVAEWVKSLRPGDRVIVTPGALFPAWTNYVSRAEVEVYTSCLPDSRSRTSVRPDGELLATSIAAPFRKRYWWSYYAVRGCSSAGFDHDEDLLLWT